MALLHIEGFETRTSWRSLSREYFIWNGTDTGASATGRDGVGKAMDLDLDSNRLFFHLNADQDTYVIGFAHNFSTDVSHDMTRVYSRRDGTNTETLTMRYVAGGNIAVDRGSTQLAVTSGLGLTTGTWYYIELKWKIADAPNGAYEVKVDGVTTSLSDFAVDTNNTTSSVAGSDIIQLAGETSVSVNLYDDIYILDSTGTLNNDYLGDCYVETLAPTGDGTTNQFTPLSGLTNYEMVDDAQTVNVANYVESSTSGHVDLYTHGAIVQPTNGIRGIKVTHTCQICSAGTRRTRNVVRSNGANYESADRSVFVASLESENYVRDIADIWEADPDTSALWTESAFNASEFGFKIQS